MLSKDMKLVVDAVKEARKEADRSHSGGEVDICNVLLKVVKEWEANGKDWIFKHYWQANPDPEISNWRGENG